MSGHQRLHCSLALLVSFTTALGCSEDTNGGGVRQAPGGDVPALQPGQAPLAGMQAAPVAGQMPIAGAGVAGSDALPTGEAGAGQAGAAGVVAGAGGDTAPVEDPIMDPVAGEAMAGAGGDPMTTAGASGSATPPPSLDTCPQPPADAPAQAVEAWTIVNEMRLAAGSGCMNLVPELVASAQGHCDYREANASNPSCMPDGHTQVTGCTGFTGRNVQEREVAAGYPRTLAYTEVYVGYGSPAPAIQSWLDTVYHRIPLYDPWTADMGYGGTAGCDVIDIGRGESTVPADAIAVYPYDGQLDVPPSWSGLEGPQPPAPPSGWPSSYPISIYGQEMSVTEHVLTKDGDATPLDHLWLDESSPEIASLRPYFRTVAFLYGAPFEPNTTYRVRITGTYVGGALEKEWTFTTGAERRFGF